MFISFWSNHLITSWWIKMLPSSVPLPAPSGLRCSVVNQVKNNPARGIFMTTLFLWVFFVPGSFSEPCSLLLFLCPVIHYWLSSCLPCPIPHFVKSFCPFLLPLLPDFLPPSCLLHAFVPRVLLHSRTMKYWICPCSVLFGLAPALKASTVCSSRFAPPTSIFFYGFLSRSMLLFANYLSIFQPACHLMIMWLFN